jgi:hypothetical protein
VACPSGHYSGNFGILYEIKWTILKFLNQQYIVNTRDMSPSFVYTWEPWCSKWWLFCSFRVFFFLMFSRLQKTVVHQWMLWHECELLVKSSANKLLNSVFVFWLCIIQVSPYTSLPGVREYNSHSHCTQHCPFFDINLNFWRSNKYSARTNGSDHYENYPQCMDY